MNPQAVPNINSQTPDNNQGVWEHLEAYCRDLAKQGNELLIISGPASFNGQHLAHGEPFIPAFTWKIVVVVPDGVGSAINRINEATRVITVNIPNIAGVRSDPWSKYVVSVNQLEALTGFRFSTALSPELAAVLKTKVDGRASEPNATIAVKTLAPATTSSPPEPDWVLIAIVVVAFLLILTIIVLVIFFRTRPKR